MLKNVKKMVIFKLWIILIRIDEILREINYMKKENNNFERKRINNEI